MQKAHLLHSVRIVCISLKNRNGRGEGDMIDEWLEPPEQEMPECPVCGDECEKLYKAGNEIVGCEHCINVIDAYEHMAEEKEARRYAYEEE